MRTLLLIGLAVAGFWLTPLWWLAVAYVALQAARGGGDAERYP